MIGIFYKIQTGVEHLHISLIRNITHWLLRKIIHVTVPLYYYACPQKSSGVNTTEVRDRKVIVTLTSFPARIHSVWLVLESLLRQTQKPDRIILWLADTQFASLDEVDKKVLAMQARGLEIRFCEDLRSHKKYFFAMQEFPDDIIITADDDIFYPEFMVGHLLAKHYEYPDCIACYRAHLITFTAGKVNPYKKWKFRAYNVAGPHHELMATGAGGVLYPPRCLSPEVFNREAILELCPTADDLWLKCMGFLKGTRTVKVFPIYSNTFTTINAYQTGLARSNVEKGWNDTQLANIINRYSIELYRPVESRDVHVG